MKHYLNNIFRRNRAPSVCFRSRVASSFSRINSWTKKKKKKKEKEKKEKRTEKLRWVIFSYQSREVISSLNQNLFKQSYPASFFAFLLISRLILN